jgi:hypothetical protein
MIDIELLQREMNSRKVRPEDLSDALGLDQKKVDLLLNGEYDLNLLEAGVLADILDIPDYKIGPLFFSQNLKATPNRKGADSGADSC